MKRPKRNFKRCLTCGRFQTIDIYGEPLRYFCRTENEGTHFFTYFGGRIRIHGDDSCDKCGIKKMNWNNVVAPNDCRFYVECFVEDCCEQEV